MEEIHAGEDGRFEFDSFEFPDSTIYNIQATTKKNGRNVLLALDPETFPETNQIWPFHSYTFNATTNNIYSDLPVTVEFLNKANRRMTYENGMRNIFLEDVVVTARKKVYKTPYESIPNAITLNEEDIKQSPMMELSTFLASRLPGIIALPQGLFRFRDLGSPNSKPIQIILNEFPVYDTQMAKIILETLQLRDIEQIDYNRNATDGLAWFPMTGSAFIAITLKKEAEPYDYMPKNIQRAQLLGHQKPAAFYSPKYEALQQKNSETPDLRTTIYWNPNIKTNRRGKTFVEFYTADGNSPYSLVIEGITKKGKLIRSEKEMIVRE